MQTGRSSVLSRDDTFFGVCEAFGEDFGFNPLFLRLAFAVALFFDPVASAASYAAAGLLVAATRWLVPEPPRPVAEVEDSAELPRRARIRWSCRSPPERGLSRTGSRPTLRPRCA